METDVYLAKDYAQRVYESCADVSSNGAFVWGKSYPTPSLFFNALGSRGSEVLNFVVTDDAPANHKPLSMPECPADANVTIGAAACTLKCADYCACSSCSDACLHPKDFELDREMCVLFGTGIRLLGSPVDCWSVGFTAAFALILVAGGLVRAMRVRRQAQEKVDAAKSSLGISVQDEGDDEDMSLACDAEAELASRALQLVASPSLPPLSRFWVWLGRSVARHPVVVLFACPIIVSIVGGIGLHFLQLEQNPEHLWVESHSTVLQQEAFFNDHFSPFWRIEQVYIVVDEPATAADRLIVNSTKSVDYLQAILEVQHLIASTPSNTSGVLLDDLCFRPIPGQGCNIQSVLGFWQSSSTTLAERTAGPDGLYTSLSHCIGNPIAADCMSAIGAPEELDAIFGGFPGSDYIHSTALVLTFLLDNPANETDRAVEWEREVFLPILDNNDALAAAGLRASYSAAISVQDELASETSTDIPTIAASYVAMLVYVSLALSFFGGACDAPRSVGRAAIRCRCTLGVGAVVIVSLAVFFAVGVGGLAGIKASLIIGEVIPFLVLAIGVDNVFLLTTAFDAVRVAQRANSPFVWASHDVEEQASAALLMNGTSIALAAACETVAFALGSLTRMPAVQSFAAYAAIAIAADFVLQITFFVALLTLDSQRRTARRIECLPCLGAAATSRGKADTDPLLAAPPPRGFGATAGSHIGAGIDSGRRPGGVGSPAVGSDPSSPSASSGALGLSGSADWVHRVAASASRLIVSRLTLIVTPILFAGLFFILANRAALIDLGLEQQVALPDDSYLQDYFADQAELGRIGPPVFLVVRDTKDLGTLHEMNRLCGVPGCDRRSVIAQIDTAPYFTGSVYSWLDDYLTWLSQGTNCCALFPNGTWCPDPAYNMDCTACVNITPTDLFPRPASDVFYDFLPHFIGANVSGNCEISGLAYPPDVRFGQGAHEAPVVAARFRGSHSVLANQTAFIDALRVARTLEQRIQQDLGLDVFFYSIFYPFFEQYLYIARVAALCVGLALGAVFLVSLPGSRSIGASTIITVVCAMVVIDLVGAMAYWEVRLNAVSTVNLVMCAGITVEFCSHITLAFLRARGTGIHRARTALVSMGPSVFAGITLTKFVGVVVLGFASSAIFQVYYFRMYLLIVLLGAAHGFLLLPVLLALFGPTSMGTSEREAAATGRSRRRSAWPALEGDTVA
jgi:Niemann-Pick C1 protein